MHYKTNSSEFDFPAWRGEPKKKYAIISTPRSGSNMLVRSLWQSGVAGAPEEYLTPLFMSDFADRFSKMRADLSSESNWFDGKQNFDGNIAHYLDLLKGIRTSPNGVFGIKVHATHFFFEHLRLLDLKQALNVERIIVIRRRNKIRQAISLIFAQETDQWIDDPEWESISRPIKKASSQISYSKLRIDQAITYIENLEVFVRSLIESWRLPTKEITYEDLCEKFSESISNVLAFIDVPNVNKFDEVNIKKQDDPIKEEWYEKYIAAS